NYDGVSDFGDILTLLGSGNYNSGQTFSSASAARGLAVAAKATPKLATTPQVTTLGIPNDGLPDFEYNPVSGDVIFRRDGGNVNGVTRVSALQIQSASGQLIVNNSKFNGPTDVLSPTSLSGANFATSGYGDVFDLGLILPAGLLPTQLTNDLTVKYQIFGQGAIRLADVTVPEPTGIALAGL